jgi:hypothetical protein
MEEGIPLTRSLFNGICVLKEAHDTGSTTFSSVRLAHEDLLLKVGIKKKRSQYRRSVRTCRELP